MAIARYGDAAYSVELAESTEERAQVFALRESEYRVAQPYLLSPKDGAVPRAEDKYDERSFIFACARKGEREALATCRFTVPQRGRFELCDLADAWTRPDVPDGTLVETSRVVVRRDQRATGLVEVMLLLAGTWLLQETPLRYNFAVCARPLERLYARLGMRLTSGEELLLRGRPVDRRYVVIHGDMMTSQPAVMARLAAHGWQLSESASSRRRAGT